MMNASSACGDCQHCVPTRGKFNPDPGIPGLEAPGLIANYNGANSNIN